MTAILSHASLPFARRGVQAAVLALGMACGLAAQAGPVLTEHATGQTPLGDHVVASGQRTVFDLDVTAYLPLNLFEVFLQVDPIVADQAYQFGFWDDHGGTGLGPSSFGVETGPDALRHHGYGIVAGSILYNQSVADDGLFSMALVNLGSGDITFRLTDLVSTTPDGRFDLFDPVAATVPEPGSHALFAVAALAALVARRRRA